MTFYKLCDCGIKVTFERRPDAPRKCECGRHLFEKPILDEADLPDEEPDAAEKIESELQPPTEDVCTYSLDAVDGSFSIAIPPSGGIVGRQHLGMEHFVDNSAISRAHLEVAPRGKLGVGVTDVSRFGTTVGSERLIRDITKLIRPGTIVKLYETELLLVRHKENNDGET